MRPGQNLQYLSNVSLGANVVGNSETLQHMVGCCFQAQWTGASAAGTIKLQASNDQNNWEDIPSSVQTINGAGSFMWNIVDAMYPYIRLVFARSSGTGSINATFYSKGV